jgi:urea transport system permease protein
LLFVCLLIAQFIRKNKLGRILVAMRDREERVRFSGYDVANFKIFVFCLAAAISSVGGAMFTLQVGFMSPSFVGIVPSIEMVIFCAVGGRLSILGAVYGSLLVNWAKTSFSESFPELWLFAMGALFIGVVMAFPNGLASLFLRYIEPYLPAWYHGKAKPVEPAVAVEKAPLTIADTQPETAISKSIEKQSDETVPANSLEGGVYVD